MGKRRCRICQKFLSDYNPGKECLHHFEKRDESGYGVMTVCSSRKDIGLITLLKEQGWYDEEMKRK
jgi:hypothetical protein